MTRTLVTPGTDADLIGLELADLGAGESLERRCEQETVVVVLSGVVEASADGTSLGRAGGRTSVFDGPGHAVYAPPGTQVRLTAQGQAELAIATAPLDGRPPAPARIIAPADQRMAEVGKGNWSRSVRTILGPEHAAGRILIGETINPPGNWSSYPPHKHDVQDPPHETRLEEVYFFRVDPPGGFGVQSATTPTPRRRSPCATTTWRSSGAAITRWWRPPATRCTTCGSWPVMAAR